MMRLYIAVMLLTVAVELVKESEAKSNCNVGLSCLRCPNRSYLFFKKGGKYHWAIVCCKSCSRYYRAGVLRRGGGKDDIAYCACYHDRMAGNCLKGNACASCTRRLHFRRMPVCCPKCAFSRMTVNATLCNCQ